MSNIELGVDKEDGNTYHYRIVVVDLAVTDAGRRVGRSPGPIPRKPRKRVSPKGGARHRRNFEAKR